MPAVCPRSCLFVHKGIGNQLNMILVYVDDIIVLSANDMHIDEMEKEQRDITYDIKQCEENYSWM